MNRRKLGILVNRTRNNTVQLSTFVIFPRLASVLVLVISFLLDSRLLMYMCRHFFARPDQTIDPRTVRMLVPVFLNAFV